MIYEHVTSLFLSKCLHDRELKKESIYYWYWNKALNDFSVVLKENSEIGEYSCPAYLATELLEWLPTFIKVWKENNYLRILKSSAGDYQVEYSKPGYAFSCMEHDELLQNALAKMLIYLDENGLIDVKSLD